MKKILFLLLICVVKLSAYEIEIYNNTNATGSRTRYIVFLDSNGVLTSRYILANNNISDYVDNTFINNLNDIKTHINGYINNIEFENNLKNNLDLLNAFFIQQPQAILNYYYNDNRFSFTNYIYYENYELLFNSDGLAVESIVNGRWAGLYDGPDQSGYLYDEKGDLKYINGVSPSFFESSSNKLMRKFGINLQSIFIRQIFYPLLILIFACVVLRAVIRLAFQAFLIRFYDKKIGQLEKRREKIENA